jgi:hypothetical protein
MKSHLALLFAATVGWTPAQEPLTSLIPHQTDPDTALVLSLLGENLSKRTFSFATVAAACSGKKVPRTNGSARRSPRQSASLWKSSTGQIPPLAK